MNHLAHLFLSQSNVQLIIGNFIADHVKGKQIEEYSEKVVRGINMHRAIDEFTDSHPQVIISKERLYSQFHKYSPVIVDMFYDHILAANWSDYSPIQLKSFTLGVYRSLESHKDTFPPSAARFFEYMSTYDWIADYASYEGIGAALNGMAKRASFDSKMEQATAVLEENIEVFHEDFKIFFPELVAFSANWLKENE